MSTPNSTDISYRINARDELIQVGEGWSSFALENDGGDLAGDQVLGRSLWGFIDDESTRRLYRQILKGARGGKTMVFPFRCDGPGERRHLEMTVSPASRHSGEVDFLSRSVFTESRLAMPLLSRHCPRSADLIRSCAWCNRFGVGEGEWVDIEDAIRRLCLFGKSLLPGITHGICPDCSAIMKAHIAEMNRLTP